MPEGARVAITARSPESFVLARQEFGDAVLYISSMHPAASGQTKVAETTKQSFGALDVLFVNAGIAELKPIEQWDEAAYDRTFQTNVRGPFFLIQCGVTAHLLQSVLNHPQRIYQCTHRNAEYQCVRREQGGIALAGTDSLG